MFELNALACSNISCERHRLGGYDKVAYASGGRTIEACGFFGAGVLSGICVGWEDYRGVRIRPAVQSAHTFIVVTLETSQSAMFELNIAAP